MYAIVFDLDQDALSTHAQSFTDAYADIKRTLEGHGFSRQQGSVYFGDVAKIDAVSCVLAVMDVASQFPWFSLAVKDIRMLRIEENTDLMPAVLKASDQATNERLLDPAAHAELEAAREWRKNNPAKVTDLAALESLAVDERGPK